MLVRKIDFQQFKNLPVYQAAQEDVRDAVQRALAEIMLSEEVTVTRHAFLKGFVEGCRAILDWEPSFVEDQEGEDNHASES